MNNYRKFKELSHDEQEIVIEYLSEFNSNKYDYTYLFSGKVLADLRKVPMCNDIA